MPCPAGLSGASSSCWAAAREGNCPLGVRAAALQQASSAFLISQLCIFPPPVACCASRYRHMQASVSCIFYHHHSPPPPSHIHVMVVAAAWQQGEPFMCVIGSPSNLSSTSSSTFCHPTFPPSSFPSRCSRPVRCPLLWQPSWGQCTAAR